MARYIKLDSSVREKFEGEARPADCSNLTYRILKQADYIAPFRAYLIVNIELFIVEHPVSLGERGLSLIKEQKDSR